MTKLSDISDPIPGEPSNPISEDGDRFYKCEQCGQLVDRRDLNQVIWHEMPGHEPLETDA